MKLWNIFQSLALDLWKTRDEFLKFLKERGEAFLSHCTFHSQAQRTEEKVSKCKPSSCTSAWGCSLASPPLQQPQAKGMAKEWEQETPECFLWLLSPPLMIYISGAFRDSNGFLCLKVTVFTNEFWSLMLKCKFVPVAYVGFCSEAPSKKLGCRNRCTERPQCHQNSVSVLCL